MLLNSTISSLKNKIGWMAQDDCSLSFQIQPSLERHHLRININTLLMVGTITTSLYTLVPPTPPHGQIPGESETSSRSQVHWPDLNPLMTRMTENLHRHHSRMWLTPLFILSKLYPLCIFYVCLPHAMWWEICLLLSTSLDLLLGVRGPSAWVKIAA